MVKTGVEKTRRYTLIGRRQKKKKKKKAKETEDEENGNNLFSVRQSWWWRPARVLRGRCDENRRGVQSLPLDQPLPT